jgi:hypothetical protein
MILLDKYHKAMFAIIITLFIGNVISQCVR